MLVHLFDTCKEESYIRGWTASQNDIYSDDADADYVDDDNNDNNEYVDNIILMMIMTTMIMMTLIMMMMMMLACVQCAAFQLIDRDIGRKVACRCIVFVFVIVFLFVFTLV